MRYFTALPLLAFVFVACSVESGKTGDDGALAARSDDLVGGHVATESEYPSTVTLGGCTGVKVGPRHFLSAAHCFGDSNQQQLAVSSDNDAQNFVYLTVSSINVHPQYTSCTACDNDGSMSDFGFRPDVALVIVQELTPDIPQAVIDSTPVTIGDPVTLSGYGCENGVGQPSGPSRFKVGDTDSVDPLDLSDAASIPDGYVTTYGPGIDPNSPGLCPGDSGGPLFRTGTNLVVGINALVSFDGELGTPFGNWHTRLDQQSRYDVWTWLSNLITQPTLSPCSDICASPTPFTTPYFSVSPLGSEARCFETTADLSSGNCGGFTGSRTFQINETPVSCDGQSWTLPAKRNGGYCLDASAGPNSWAWLTTW